MEWIGVSQSYVNVCTSIKLRQRERERKRERIIYTYYKTTKQMIASVVDFVGRHVPLILILTGMFLLWQKENYFNYFLWGYFFSTLLNTLLKGLFKLPRPMHDGVVLKAMNDHNKLHGHNYYLIPFQIYGMPSGHAQAAFYCTSFITLVLKNTKVTIFFTLMSFLTLFQRVNSRYHSFNQVVVGSIIGLLLGGLVYFMAREHIMGKLVARLEDYGPR